MYLLLLLVLLGCFALIDRRWALCFWSGRPWRALLVLVAGVVFFLAWDLVGIANGLFWHGENSLTLGVFVAPELPLEEVFFLAFLGYQTLVYVQGAPVLWRWLRSRAAGHSSGPTGHGGPTTPRGSEASAAPTAAGDPAAPGAPATPGDPVPAGGPGRSSPQREGSRSEAVDGGEPTAGAARGPERGEVS